MNSLLRLLGLDSSRTVHSIDEHLWRLESPLSREWLLLLLVLGVALAALNFLPPVRMRARVRLYTFLLRLGMVLTLLLVFQKLELHLQLNLEEKHRWLVLLDDTGSMQTRDEAGVTRYAAARRDLDALAKAAGDQVILEVQSFSGSALSDQPGSGPTRIQPLIESRALSRTDLTRLLLLTDGRDVEGRDFSRLGRDLRDRGIRTEILLYGSDSPPNDSSVFAEPERAVLRLGEELVVRGSISGPSAQKTCSVELKENGKKVKEVAVPPEETRWFLLSHKPAKEGSYEYTLELVGSDLLPSNNSTTFKAQVVKEKIKVLLIEGYPRFEFKLVKAALEVDPLVHLVTLCHLPGGGVYVQGEPLHDHPEQGLVSSQAELFKYDVVILRDVPRSLFRAGGDISESRLRTLLEFVLKRGGGLVALGGQDVYRAGGYEDSALMEILPFDLTDHFSKEPQFESRFFVNVPKAAYTHPLLRLLPDPQRNRERWNGLRELDGSNNVGRFKPLATPLLTRFVKIKNSQGEMDEKEVPLLAYQAVGEGKVIAAAVDTFWRWQLQPDFDDPPLQGLLANFVRYLAPDPQSKPGSPSVSLADASPQVGQEAVLHTLLRDKNYDPIRGAELKVMVKRPDGRTNRLYPRDLSDQPGYYEYRVSLDMPGVYEVAVEYNKNQQVTSFVAGASGSEFADLSVNRKGMEALARGSGGGLVQDFHAWLLGIKAIPFTRSAHREVRVWNSPAVLLLFLLLVSLDCYIRKRQGLP